MRKYVSILLAFVLLIALAVPAAAAEAPKFKTYKLDELPISVSLPEDYGCFTMTTKPDDQLFGKYQRDGVKMLEWMVKNELFMVGVAPDNKSEFRLNIDTNEAFKDEKDFIEVDEDYLTNTAEATAENLESKGAEVIDFGFYMSAQLNYVYVVYDSEQSGHVATFYTVTNVEDDAAMITLDFVTEKSIDDDVMEMLYLVADNLNIQYYPIYFYDEAGQALITAPVGCYSVPEMTDAETPFCVRLPEGSFGFVTYSIQDGKDVGDLTKVSVEEFAKANEVPADQIAEETYNGQRYLVSYAEQSVKLDGKDATIDVYTFYTTYNDTLIMIQYYENGAEEGKNMEVFEELMNAIEYGEE